MIFFSFLLNAYAMLWDSLEESPTAASSEYPYFCAHHEENMPI